MLNVFRDKTEILFSFKMHTPEIFVNFDKYFVQCTIHQKLMQSEIANKFHI